MFKKMIYFCCILFLIFSLGGCKTKNSIEKAVFFEYDQIYYVGYKIETLQSKGSFRFDKNGDLHFLHEDPTSPLFGMEEVFCKDSVTSYFNGVQYENSSYFGGIADLRDCLLLIHSSKPSAFSKKSGEKTYQFDAENTSFKIVLSENDNSPERILGIVNGKEFSINFSSEA